MATVPLKRVLLPGEVVGPGGVEELCLTSPGPRALTAGANDLLLQTRAGCVDSGSSLVPTTCSGVNVCRVAELCVDREQ